MSKYLILEVNRDHFRLLQIRHRVGSVSGEWPRDRISDAHINRYDGKLRFNLQGDDPVEISLSISRQANEWIVERLNLALRETSAPEQGHGSVDYASPFVFSDTAARSVRRERIALVICAIMMAIGVCMFFTPLGPLGIYMIIFAAIPVGIVLGTQKKEFWI